MNSVPQSWRSAARRLGPSARWGVGLAAVMVSLAACGAPAPPARAPAAPAPAPAVRPSAPPPLAAPPAAPAPAAKQLNIWLTGYSWQDNTPPGSSVVGEPVLHQQAGGTGTFADPITVAVPGHQGAMAWQPGTRFYLPTVKRYVIVEDSGASRAPAGTDTHLDMWIGGQDGTLAATNACEDSLTGRVAAELNPPNNLPVIVGSIYANQRCDIPAQADS
ncbi:hypothetical protein ACTXG6_26860 [Pseudonocardia sp. Cha107L01]|uniref:hypothetical protein n=1 Tax=Pseudonocardia sp. Cha107L01 TaxID=3457576 RepID=UPI00403E6B34